MSNEKLKGPKREGELEQVAKNPVQKLRERIARGSTCAECIGFLFNARTELSAVMPKLKGGIQGVPTEFQQFYKFGNGEVGHWIGLFTMLRNVGFTRVDIESALMDNLPIGARPDPKRSEINLNSSEVIRQYLPVTQSAFDNVFGSKE